MRNYEPVKSFGPFAASLYDGRDVHAGLPAGEKPVGDAEATVAFLKELAGDGPALEFAVGTGRIAIPLAEMGTPVDGIDFSEHMLAKLKEKSDRVETTLGNYKDVRLDKKYRLVYIVANSLSNLLTQDEQVEAFENAARHLTDDGVFVHEAGVPNWLHRLQDSQYVMAEQVEVKHVVLDVARHDPVTQTLEESHVVLTNDRVVLGPIVTRYHWPSELDLMARIAGLRLKERYDGWNKQPFTATGNCISVWGR